MTWYEDLSPCDWYGASAAKVLRAVGWLGEGRPFPTGDVDREVYERLSTIPPFPFPLPVCAGVHVCEVCRFEGEAADNGEHIIPGNGVLFIAPRMIRHYMNAHWYQPPQEFCRAVLECPGAETMDYKRAVLDNGGRALIAALKELQQAAEG